MDSLTVRTADGRTLHVRRLPPLGPRRATVLLLHAMMVDGRTMDRPAGAGLATCLTEHGLEVYIADFRGHGASGPGASDGGHWTYDDLVFHDVPALLEAISRREPGPLWVVGHSLGAHVTIASLAAGACSVVPHGNVLIAGNVWMPSLEGSRRRRLQKTLAMRLFRKVSRVFGRWPSRRLRMGPADEALAYVEDLARFWHEDAWRSRDGHDYLAGMTGIEGPILCITGAGDQLFGHVEGARAFAEQLGPGRATFVHCRAGRGGLSWDPDHMGLVTDARSRPIWERIAQFIGDEVA